MQRDTADRRPNGNARPRMHATDNSETYGQAVGVRVDARQLLVVEGGGAVGAAGGRPPLAPRLHAALPRPLHRPCAAVERPQHRPRRARLATRAHLRHQGALHAVRQVDRHARQLAAAAAAGEGRTLHVTATPRTERPKRVDTHT